MSTSRRDPGTADARSRVAQVARGQRSGRAPHPTDHLGPRRPSAIASTAPKGRAGSARTSAPRAPGRRTVSVSSRPTAARPSTPSGARRTPSHTRTGTAASTRPSRAHQPSGATSARELAASAVAGVRAVGDFFTRTTPHPGARDHVPTQVTRSSTRRRLRWTIVVLSALFALIVWELIDVQLLNPTAFAAFGESQRVRTETLAADRGTIYDRNGVELAMSTPQRSIFTDPLLVEDAAAEAALLAPILGQPASELTEKLSADNRFTYLARQVPPEIADRVEALKQAPGPDGRPVDEIPGVHLIEEPKRFQPSGDVASSIVGQVDIDGNGISGLEQQYTEQLTGTPGELVLERTPQGRTIAAGDQSLIPAERGQDLELTLDRALQFDTERILSDQVADAGAKSGMAIVMKPDTGEILAMANVASDPETGEVSVSSNNAGLTTVYEPGSVMKVVSVAGAIENGKVEPDTVIGVPDEMMICDQRFQEHDYHGNVGWPVSTILAQSSNIGTIKLAEQIGKEELYRYMREFGFGETTAVQFPNEAAGSVKAPADWDCSSRGSFPIGQGVSVTPLQMLQAYNTIANGGVYVPPKLVNALVDADGTRHPNVPDESDVRRVISRDTARQMNVMLRSVVQEGTGQLASITGYTPAGKTGTSRKPHPDGGYTWPDGAMHYQATFVGFVPAEAPELSIIVIIDEPTKEGIYGGVVAAPAFAKIGETALRHYAIAPPASDLAAEGLGGVEIEDVTSPATATDAPTESAITRTPDGRVRGPAAGSSAQSESSGLATGETDLPPSTTSTTIQYGPENNWGAGGPPTTVQYGPENNWGAGGPPTTARYGPHNNWGAG